MTISFRIAPFGLTCEPEPYTAFQHLWQQVVPLTRTLHRFDESLRNLTLPVSVLELLSASFDPPAYLRTSFGYTNEFPVVCVNHTTYGISNMLALTFSVPHTNDLVRVNTDLCS